MCSQENPGQVYFHISKEMIQFDQFEPFSHSSMAYEGNSVMHGFMLLTSAAGHKSYILAF